MQVSVTGVEMLVGLIQLGLPLPFCGNGELSGKNRLFFPQELGSCVVLSVLDLKFGHGFLSLSLQGVYLGSARRDGEGGFSISAPWDGL